MTAAAEALAAARHTLEAAGIPEAALEAEVLVMHAAGWDRVRLYASLREPLPPEALAALEAALARRLRREPLAYITGRREFYALDIAVNRHVLVPRPETEHLVEEVLAIARAGYAQGPLAIADVGTGSGAIAVALAVHLPWARIHATDASPEALEVAAANARRHGVAARIAFAQGDLLAPVAGPLDIAAANLPYIPTGERPFLQPEVRDHEPLAALDGGPDGLAQVRRLLRQVADRPQRPRWVVLELGEGQAPAAIAQATALLPGARCRVYRDLAGLDRGLVVQV